MKKYCFLLLLFFGCHFDSPDPRYFQAELAQHNSVTAWLYGRQDKSKKYYSITREASLASSSSAVTDTLQLINDLLLFKGDTRICMKPVMSYCAESSTAYATEDYSIQVEALFRINELFLKSHCWTSPAPVLMDKNTGKRECIGGDIVDRAYRAYYLWFSQVETIGLTQARKQGIMPLDGSSIFWY